MNIPVQPFHDASQTSPVHKIFFCRGEQFPELTPCHRYGLYTLGEVDYGLAGCRRFVWHRRLFFLGRRPLPCPLHEPGQFPGCASVPDPVGGILDMLPVAVRQFDDLHGSSPAIKLLLDQRGMLTSRRILVWQDDDVRARQRLGIVRIPLPRPS